MSIFSERLHIARKRKGLKQKQLAKQINVSSQNYNHYEKGRYEPSLDGLKALSEILEVSVDWLIGNKQSYTSSFTLANNIEDYEIIPVLQNISYNDGKIYGELKINWPKLSHIDKTYNLATIVSDDGLLPYLKKDDVVLINTKSNSPIFNRYFLIDFDSLNFISKAIEIDNKLKFKITNTNIILEENYHIIGEVVGNLTFFDNGIGK